MIANAKKKTNVEDVYDGFTELLSLDVTQERISAADAKEVTQYIESAASTALDMRETKKVLRESRRRVGKKARVAPAVDSKREVVRIESDHDWVEQDLTKYLPLRGRLASDIFNGC